MYLLPIQIPIYLDGPRRLLSTEWRRSLLLLRDSLGGRLGRIEVVAPSLPVKEAREQRLEPAGHGEGDDDLVLHPSLDKRIRFKAFVMRGKAEWLGDVMPLVARATVVHAGLDDLWRPFTWSAFRLAVRAGKPTVFVQDTDVALQVRQIVDAAAAHRRVLGRVYARLYERRCRGGVRQADLPLLKGARLMRKYGPLNPSARLFHDTSHSTSDIVDGAVIDRRLARRGGPLKLVYFGRMIPRKGLGRAVALVRRARQRGADVRFDLIGDGPERASLMEAAGNPAASGITFHDAVAYGSGLLRRVAEYDGLLFTPAAEDTPRMIFDGYAAGLPLIAGRIDYTIERSAEGTTVLLPDDDAQAVERLCGLWRDRTLLAPAARAAHRMAYDHAAEAWYARRAAWTFDMLDRRNRRSTTSVIRPDAPIDRTNADSNRLLTTTVDAAARPAGATGV